jgi:hypothetical protein
MSGNDKQIITVQVKLQSLKADLVVIAEQIRGGGLKGRAAACAVSGVEQQLEYLHNLVEGLKGQES